MWDIRVKAVDRIHLAQEKWHELQGSIKCRDHLDLLRDNYVSHERLCCVDFHVTTSNFTATCILYLQCIMGN
jgi:hypothetical protein